MENDDYVPNVQEPVLNDHHNVLVASRSPVFIDEFEFWQMYYGDEMGNELVWNESHAACLDEYSLELIFSHLSIIDQISAARVCPRWGAIIQRMWLKIRVLDFSNDPLRSLLLNNCEGARFLTTKTLNAQKIVIHVDDVTLSGLIDLIATCPNFDEIDLGGFESL